MSKWIKRIGLTLMILLGIAAGVAWWAARQTKHVPEFYAQAVKSPPADPIKASRRMQEQVEKLRESATKIGSWKATFTDQEINAWLMQELPEKFPQLLKRGVKEPRLVIEDDRMLIAAQYKDKRIETVVSFEIRAKLTEEPNMLALHISNLRAGALPLSLDRFRAGITKEAAKGDLRVRWDMTDTGPIALIEVPTEHPKYVVSPVIVESVKLEQGQLMLAGHTGPQAEESYRPLSPVHRFVSYRAKSNSKSQASRSASSRTRLR